MSRSIFVGLSAVLIGCAAFTAVAETNPSIPLPVPALDSEHSIESVLRARRSTRDIAEAPISLANLGQLLWAAQGITSAQGLRTAPSAGALYPLEIYVLVGNVDGLLPGLYHYQPRGHRLVLQRHGDIRSKLAAGAVNQSWVARNAAVIAFCAVFSRTAKKYGGRGERYVFMEVGHAAQNVLLQVQSLGLAAGVVGAFNDRALDELLELPRGERALYLVPVGKPEL